MHTYQAKESKFHYSSDLSGDVTIYTNQGLLDVSCDDILDFVAYVIRGARLAQLEKSLDAATARAILGLPD